MQDQFKYIKYDSIRLMWDKLKLMLYGMFVNKKLSYTEYMLLKTACDSNYSIALCKSISN